MACLPFLTRNKYSEAVVSVFVGKHFHANYGNYYFLTNIV